MTRTRIGRTTLAVAALAFGAASATAVAQQGADDGTAGTGTTGTTVTVPTTPSPGVTRLPGRKIRIVGTVVARDETARTFTVTTKRHVPQVGRAVASAARRAKIRPRRAHGPSAFTVRARRAIPALGSFVLVKGRWLRDGTIRAERVKVLRSGERDGARGRDGETSDRGRGGAEQHGHRGHGRGQGRAEQHTHRGRGRG